MALVSLKIGPSCISQIQCDSVVQDQSLGLTLKELR